MSYVLFATRCRQYLDFRLSFNIGRYSICINSICINVSAFGNLDSCLCKLVYKPTVINFGVVNENQQKSVRMLKTNCVNNSNQLLFYLFPKIPTEGSK